VAAKLKQMTPRLVAAMKREADEIASIHVQVQPRRPAKDDEKKRPKPALTPDAVAHFEQLAAAVDDDALKSALRRLVARHRSKTQVR
jgi:hypothetical protein